MTFLGQPRPLAFLPLAGSAGVPLLALTGILFVFTVAELLLSPATARSTRCPTSASSA